MWKIKMGRSRSNIAFNKLLRIRTYILLCKNVLKDKLITFAYYVWSGLSVALLVMIGGHPIITYAVLMHYNVVGDYIRNIVFGILFLADCGFAFALDVMVDYARKK